MSTLGSITHWAKQARAHIGNKRTSPQTSQGGIWHWINSVAQGVKHLFSGPLSIFAKAIGFWAHYAFWFDREIYNGIRALAVWIINGIHRWLAQYVNKRFARIEAQLRVMHAELVRRINQASRRDRAYALALFLLEKALRRKAVQQAEHQARMEVRALHHAIEREAVSGYKAAQNQRLSTIQRVADLIANQNPVTRTLVKDLIAGVLDLVAIDNPVARIALTFLLRHIIDRLGLDKVIGQLLHALLAPLLGQPKPRGLSDVIADICARLNGLEGQWADFMQHGGPEVEQAGDEWKGLTSLVGDAALLVFLGSMCYAPQTFARDLSGTVGAVVNDTIIGATNLLRKA